MALELRVISSIEDVPQDAWNACTNGHPFVQHAFLKALETTGALGRSRGVLPRHVLLIDSTYGLVACAPAMLKWGTLREYGPEIHWIKAGVNADCFEWPKFQVGVPFFPVMGPKILVRKGFPAAPLLSALIRGMCLLQNHKTPKTVFNVLCIDRDMAKTCHAHGAIIASEFHSIWTNKDYSDWHDYVLHLSERKRYQLRRERRLAESHELTFSVLKGFELKDEVLADYYEGHRQVCTRYGGKPWLPGGVYEAIVRIFPQAARLMGYFDGSRLIAGSLQLLESSTKTLYLLQWSELKKISNLPLDLICYRPIEYALSQDISRVDSGLVAEHKQHRGWEKTAVYHAHWFANDALKALAQKQLGQDS